MKQLAIAILFSLLLAACGTPTADGTGLIFRTADPRLSFGVRLLQPVPIAEEEVGEILPDPVPVPPCEITKGNISKDGRRLYHVAGMSNFNTVKIDEDAGERFFCSPDEAEANGWVRAGN